MASVVDFVGNQQRFEQGQREKSRFQALEQDRTRNRQEQIKQQALKFIEADPKANVQNLLPPDTDVASERFIREFQKSLLRKQKEQQERAQAEGSLGQLGQLGAITQPSPQELGQQGPPTAGRAAFLQGREGLQGFPGLEAQLDRGVALERARAVGGLGEQTGPEAVTEREEGRADVRARARAPFDAVYDLNTGAIVSTARRGSPELDAAASAVDAEGNRRFAVATTGVTGGADAVISPLKTDDLVQKAFQIDENINLATDLAASLIENRNRAGFGLSINKAIRNGRGIAQTIDTFTGGNFQSVLAEAQLDLQSKILNESLYSEEATTKEEREGRERIAAIAFDPDISSNEVSSTLLAFALFRDSKGGLRSVTAFKRIEKLTRLTDFAGADAVIARMLQLVKISRRRRKEVDFRLGRVTGGKPRIAEIDPPEFTIEELQALDRISRKHGQQ